MKSSAKDAGLHDQNAQRRTPASLAVLAARLADHLTADIIGGALLLILLFTVVSIMDISGFNSRAMEQVKERDISKLRMINPDTAAWLIIDGTHIDNPVVQGKDNFEYLDLDFHRNYYAGGTLFLDIGNSKCLTDSYNVIHGHHMSEGAMFGDLDLFLDKEFFKENFTGTVITERGQFRLDIIAAGTADAYDSDMYNVRGEMAGHIDAILKSASHVRKRKKLKSMLSSGRSRMQGSDDKQILLLSTCTGDMDDSRTIVTCLMYPEKNNVTDQDLNDAGDDIRKREHIETS